MPNSILCLVNHGCDDLAKSTNSGNTYSIEIFNSCHDAHCHFSSVSWSFRTWIEGCSETFAYFLHSRLQLVTLEENDEHRFIYLVALQQSKKKSSYWF